MAETTKSSSNNECRDDKPTSSSFVTSRWTLVATVTRILLVCNLFIPADLSLWMMSANNLRSVLIDPVFTLAHVYEAKAIRQLVATGTEKLSSAPSSETPPTAATTRRSINNKGRVVDSYRGHESGHSRTHLPPLMLVAVESFLSLWREPMNPLQRHDDDGPTDIIWQQQVALALLLLLVDLYIGRTLESLTKNVLDREGKNHELAWTTMHMNPKITPNMAHVFPISSHSTPPRFLSSTTSNSSSLSPVLFHWNDLPLCVAQLYYCSPITILAGSGPAMSCCFQNIRLACLVTALCEASSSSVLASNGRRRSVDESSATTSALSLAVATYLDVHCLVFLIPIAIWHGAIKAKTVGVLWDFYMVSLLALSALLVGDDFFSIVATTHLYPFTLARHPPSLSTLWYFGMQMFGRFRSYFEFLLGGFPYLLVVPVTIRLHQYPAVLVRLVQSCSRLLRRLTLNKHTDIPRQVAIFWFMGVLFRPPGTLYNLNVGLCFFLMNPRTLARMHQLSSLFVLFAIPIPVVLYMVGYWMWLEPNNGEANYVFFQCLAYNIFLTILFHNFCAASLRRDKALRLTIKESRKIGAS